jgi:negative regulator of genetic competence, sporulation and motility
MSYIYINQKEKVMKIEKISENKLKIIMPISELSKHNINLLDIKKRR